MNGKAELIHRINEFSHSLRTRSVASTVCSLFIFMCHQNGIMSIMGEEKWVVNSVRMASMVLIQLNSQFTVWIYAKRMWLFLIEWPFVCISHIIPWMCEMHGMGDTMHMGETERLTVRCRCSFVAGVHAIVNQFYKSILQKSIYCLFIMPLTTRSRANSSQLPRERRNRAQTWSHLSFELHRKLITKQKLEQNIRNKSNKNDIDKLE